MLDKRDTVSIFRERLGHLIERSHQSQARFAADAGLDRSTLSQLLSEATVRLPRAETIARIATRYNVSIDWLLGLSQTDRVGTDILRQLEIETGERSHVDDLLARWHREAAGYKIRYVPMSLPDLLKTDEVIEYEYRNWASVTAEARKEEAEERLAYSRKPETDIEACTSRQILEQFAEGSGIWVDLTPGQRRVQLERMVQLTDELYPTFRWFLFDGRNTFTSPYTIFGPQRAALYVGKMFFVFNSTEHIRVLTRHFDGLIRDAVVQPNECGGFVRTLLDRVG
ncbi:MAG: helix-turn-helix domain-containing protein [Hyphomicrobiales bacterium]